MEIRCAIPRANSLIQWMTPAQLRKSTVVSIRSDPFRTRFNSKSGQVGVRNKISPGPSFTAKLQEQSPVAPARAYNDTGRRIVKTRHKSHRCFQGRRRVKYRRMGEKAEAATENQLADTEWFRPANCLLQPVPVLRMSGRLFAVGIYENIDIGQDQSVPSIRSSNSAELSRSTPGRSSPLNVVTLKGSSATASSPLFKSALRASEITSFSVFPLSIAAFLASVRRSSSSLIVVRIHFDARS